MALTLTDTHADRSYSKRGKRLSQKQLDEYDRVQRLIEEIEVDLVNGALRSDIFNKFRERKYENLSEKNIGERQIQNYIRAAWEILRENRVEKVNELRDLLFNQYMNQYAEATAMGNPIAAKSVLDSIAKIFLPDEKNINLQAKVEGDITIDFQLIEEDEG